MATWKHTNMLSLKKTSNTDMTYNSPLAKLDLSGNSYVVDEQQPSTSSAVTNNNETEEATKNLQKMMVDEKPEEIPLTQKDFPQRSLKLNINNTNQDTETTTRHNIIAEIDEYLRRRHHMATLAHTMQHHPRGETQQFKFLRFNLEFYPYYGSSEAKNFFTNKIREIRDEIQTTVCNKLITACDEFVAQCTENAENLMSQFSMNAGTPTQGSDLSNFHAEIELQLKWNKEFNDAVTTTNNKMKSSIDKKTNNRPTPYRRRKFHNRN